MGGRAGDGDARVLWEFVQSLYRDLPPADVAAAVKRVMKMPSLPPQLAPDALDAIPEAPGVYRFYGLNALPLYIGKAKNLRERVGAHFSSDYRSAIGRARVSHVRPIRLPGDDRCSSNGP